MEVKKGIGGGDPSKVPEQGEWKVVCKFNRFPEGGGMKEVAILEDEKGNKYLKAFESTKEGVKHKVIVKLTDAELALLGAKALGVAMR